MASPPILTHKGSPNLLTSRFIGLFEECIIKRVSKRWGRGEPEEGENVGPQMETPVQCASNSCSALHLPDKDGLAAGVGISHSHTSTEGIGDAAWGVSHAPALRGRGFPAGPVLSLPATRSFGGEPWRLT